MTRTLFAQGWAWAGMLFLMFTGLACEQLSPGVSGRVLLGRSILVAQNAQQIVINLYKPEDFDTDKKLPKPGAQPLATKVLRSVNTPPYDYELEANFPNQKVYAFAFLDQDNSGGITPTHTDVYGTHQNNPVQIGQVRLFNVGIELNKVFIRPPIQFEVTRTFEMPRPKEPNRLVVGLWKKEDISDSNIPKPGTKPVLVNETNTFGSTPWKIKIQTNQKTETVIPFVFLDLDGKGGTEPEKGDPYAIWKGEPIDLSKPYTKPLEFILDTLYSGSP